MPRRPALAALCERAGVLPDYSEAGTGLRRRVSDPTRAALLAAMGWDASTEAAARASLAAWEAERAARLIEPVAVEPPGRGRRRLRVCVPSEARGPLDWELVVHLESGQELRRAGRTRRRPVLGLPLPGARETGYHRVELTLCDARGSWRAEQRRIAVPARCVGPAEKLGAPGARAFGLWTHLYAVRGARGTGAGEFGDLRRLCRLAGTGGADFVGLNPLHALWNRGAAVSPYAPVSRLYRNDLYLDLAAVPERADGPDPLAGRRQRTELARLRAADRIDYDAVRALRRPVLEALHRRFVRRHGGGATARGRAYRRYRAREGESLDDFATFVAIAEQRGQRDWRRWPARLRDPRSAAVRQFRAAHAHAVDFQRWLQFELDRQLGRAAAHARRAGLRIGLYTDLAVGSDAGGSDAWSGGGVYALDASAGAPPDGFNPAGQDWGFPPLDPHRLRDAGYAPWVRVLRASFAHAGAVRIDHALGLHRLYWVPRGASARAGGYVRYPEADLLGILALESRRHDALVIGEDLGTVPRGLGARLARRGVLSSRVLYFERRGTSFRPARSYSRRALVTANTHDLAPLAGWAEGRDLVLRRRAGAIASDAALARALAERRRDVAALERRLRTERILDDATDLCAAVTAFLRRTPAPLVGLSLDDLAGERDPVNLPGVPPSQHPSWTRRMTRPLESLARDSEVRRLLELARRHRPRPAGQPASGRRTRSPAQAKPRSGGARSEP